MTNDAMKLEWREIVSGEDVSKVRELTARTGFFNAEEVDIAAELVDESARKGSASGYEFIVAESAGEIAGYACYGLTPGTERSWDLYWIVVAPEMQRRGLGSTILERVEAKIAVVRGGLVWVDTSSSEAYVSTRAFYERAGYHQAALLEDFYRDGDSKVIYLKRVPFHGTESG